MEQGVACHREGDISGFGARQESNKEGFAKMGSALRVDNLFSKCAVQALDKSEEVGWEHGAGFDLLNFLGRKQVVGVPTQYI